MKRFLSNCGGRLAILGFCCTAALFLLSGTIRAEDPPQWWDQEDGVAVRQGYHIEWQRSAESGAAGEMIIGWSDTRFGMRDLFAQKIDASQPGAPALWSTDDPEHGLVDALIVNDDVIRQEDPVLISDGAGGAIVSWVDFRDDPAGDIYVNRLVDDGGPGGLAWGEDGVLLCDECANGSENMGKSHCIDGSGGSWISWSDRRGSNWDIYISHVDADGNIDPNFGVNGAVVVDEVGDQRVLSMEHDGAGGAYIAWVDKRDAADDDIYIEHIEADGDFVNGADGLPVVLAPGRQHSVKVTWDGGTGCFVAWVDQRDDNAGDIYIQHYEANLANSFSENGTPLVALADNAEKNPRLSYAGDGSTLLMWEDNRNDPGNTQADIYVQKMTVADTEQWGTGGLPATLADGNQEAARVIGDGAGGAFVVWQDLRDESHSAIYAQKLDSDGQRQWDDDGAIVVDRQDIEADAIAPSLRLDNQGGLFVAWGDLSRGSLGIFTQHLNAAGQRSFDDEGHDSAWGISGSCSMASNVATAEGTLVFWVDPRNSGGPHVHMQFLDAATGEPQLDVNGVPVDLSLEGGQLTYQVLADGEGGAYVMIEAGSDRAQQAWLTRVNNQGQPVWGESMPVTAGFDPESGLEYQERVKLLRSGEAIIVAWSGVDTDYSDFFAEVGLQRFDDAGVSYWGDDGLRITSTEDIHEKLDAIAPDGQGGVYVLWDSGDWQDTDVIVQYVNIAGQVQFDEGGMAFAEGEGKQEQALVVDRPDGGLLGLWQDFTAEGSNSDLIARAMSPAGDPIWTTEVDMRPQSQKTPVLLADGFGGAFVLYTDFSNNENDDVYQRHLLADGSLLWEDAQGEVFVADGTQEDVAAALVPRDGWTGCVVALAAEESVGDTTGHKDLWAMDSHVSPEDGLIHDTRYSGTVFNFFHNQREPWLSYDFGDGVYMSWIDMRASGKEDIRDVYSTRLASTDQSLDPVAAGPRAFRLAQNHPNPFNPETWISFQLLRPCVARLEVYNLAGQKLRTLVREQLGSGTHQVLFDGRDESGKTLASGLYVYRLSAAGGEQSRRMLLVR